MSVIVLLGRSAQQIDATSSSSKASAYSLWGARHSANMIADLVLPPASTLQQMQGTRVVVCCVGAFVYAFSVDHVFPRSRCVSIASVQHRRLLRVAA
jgi:hypothetical protein